MKKKKKPSKPRRYSLLDLIDDDTYNKMHYNVLKRVQNDSIIDREEAKNLVARYFVNEIYQFIIQNNYVIIKADKI